MFRVLSAASLFTLVLSSAHASNMLETVRVPSGTLRAFWVTPKSSSQKRVADIPLFQVKAFETMPKAVTKAQFLSFIQTKPEWQKGAPALVFADASYLSSFDGKASPQPITEVSWFAARAFCDHHGMRLPTLLEWEYLSAASEKLQDANQDPVFLRRILDWYGETKGASIKPVGSIYRNIYGAWDLHGLIWEWVEDFNTTFVTGESREDGSFNKNLFCGAGGLSGANKEDYAAFMRFAFRSSLKGNSSVWNLGFRCVRSI